MSAPLIRLFDQKSPPLSRGKSNPLKWLTEFFAKVRIFEAASRRVFRVLDEPEPIVDRSDARSLPVAPRTLSLDAVSFGYRDGHRVLGDVSATIRPGDMVAFIGPSGTGKSTLLNLLLRYYDPTADAVRLDGIDIRDVRLAEVRAHMALVGQDNLMLPTTIAENIGYGRPEAGPSQIARAAELAGAAAFVEALPDGYDTRLAEGGANLSGGQRQRIAIARALITEAPFIILDEPTSALDPAHERRLIETLHTLKGLRTIVLVTHRLESVVGCDQIFVMADGRIVERGTHRQLASRQGPYSKAASRTDAAE